MIHQLQFLEIVVRSSQGCADRSLQSAARLQYGKHGIAMSAEQWRVALSWAQFESAHYRASEKCIVCAKG